MLTMHISTGSYDDFKRIVTGTGVVPPPQFDAATGKPIAGAHPTGPIDPATGKPAPAKPKAAAVAMKGTVYQWGGTVVGGDWACAFISADSGMTISSRNVVGPEAPPTFNADFPDAVQLEGPLNFSA
jgi:hypothetical protein